MQAELLIWAVNAEYAAMLGLQACNDLRETFQEKDTIRFHPILMGVKLRRKHHSRMR